MNLKPEPGENPWQENWYKGVFEKLSAKYPEELEYIKKAVESNMPIQEFIRDFPGTECAIFLGDNCSGIDVVNLENETLHEWTW